MASSSTSQPLWRSLSNLRSDWVEVGGLGRLAVAGIVLALGVTIVLGFSITNSARGHLLDARAEMVADDVADLPPFPPEGKDAPADYVRFDVAVRVNVLGGETVRVKVWAPDGTIVYSDADELVGQTFDLPEHAAAAFDGAGESNVSDLTDPAHAYDRGHGELIEFYAPITVVDGAPQFVAEVEQDASGLNQALGQIARNVWLSIGIGIAAIGVVMAAGIAARARELNRRRRQAEELLQSSSVAQEEERRRVVSALHDDIGQPMYRLLYGIEGSQAKLSEDDPVAVELGHLADIVRDMDTTLRNELRLLHFELAADAGIATALEELAELTTSESGLAVDVSIDLDFEPSPIATTEIYRAAREAITNVRKHAGASSVTIRVHTEGGRIVLDVVDDGSVSADGTGPGLGLSTTRQRFIALEGDVTLDTMPSGGTRLRAWLPRMVEETSP